MNEDIEGKYVEELERMEHLPCPLQKRRFWRRRELTILHENRDGKRLLTTGVPVFSTIDIDGNGWSRNYIYNHLERYNPLLFKQTWRKILARAYSSVSSVFQRSGGKRNTGKQRVHEKCNDTYQATGIS